MENTRPTVVRQTIIGLGLLVMVALIAFLGSLATIPNTTGGWYDDVTKVPWSPPNWLFGPAWSLLYVMIAVGGFFLWRAGYVGNGQPNHARRALTIYSIQLALNGIWTPIFFAGYPLIGAAAWWIALVVIIALIVTVAALIKASWRWSKTAAWLFVPYLAWITFASTLNAGIIVLN